MKENARRIPIEHARRSKSQEGTGREALVLIAVACFLFAAWLFALIFFLN